MKIAFSGIPFAPGLLAACIHLHRYLLTACEEPERQSPGQNKRVWIPVRTDITEGDAYDWRSMLSSVSSGLSWLDIIKNIYIHNTERRLKEVVATARNETERLQFSIQHTCYVMTKLHSASMSSSFAVTLMFEWIRAPRAAAQGASRTRQVFDVWAPRSPPHLASCLKFTLCRCCFFFFFVPH